MKANFNIPEKNWAKNGEQGSSLGRASRALVLVSVVSSFTVESVGFRSDGITSGMWECTVMFVLYTRSASGN